MRRPLSSAYTSGPSLGMVYEDSLRRTQSYRVLKSQPAESTVPRFPERGLASDANFHPASSPTTTAGAHEEPVAFLTIGLEFSKVSTSFLNAIGRTSVTGLKLLDVLVVDERAKASRLQQQAQEEQNRKEPAYLPPIFSERSEAVMQSLGFSSEELSRHLLQWMDTFTFLGNDGQARQYPIRAGLATRNSIYFVVLLVLRMPRTVYPTPSLSVREMGGPFEPMLQHYSQPTFFSATFDPRQSRLGDTRYDPRQTGPPSASPHMMTGRIPGLPPSSAYAASPSRPDYTFTPSAYQIPRSEAHPAGRPPPTAEFQLLPLPRIRSPPAGSSQQLELPPAPPYQAWEQGREQGREERPRIGIGGLLERQNPAKSP